MLEQLCLYSTLPALTIDAQGNALLANAAFRNFWNLGEGEPAREGYNAFSDSGLIGCRIPDRLRHALAAGEPVRIPAFDYSFPRRDRQDSPPRRIAITALPSAPDHASLCLFYHPAEDLMPAAEPIRGCQRMSNIAQSCLSLRHEINNPLLLIIGHAQLLMAKSDHLPPEAQRKLEKILAAAEKIRAILREQQSLAGVFGSEAGEISP